MAREEHALSRNCLNRACESSNSGEAARQRTPAYGNSCRAHEADVVGHSPSNTCVAFRSARRRRGQTEQDLDVDLVIGRVDHSRIVDGVGVDAPASRLIDPDQWRQPRFTPSATTLQRRSRPFTRRESLARSTTAVRFARRPDIRTMPTL